VGKGLEEKEGRGRRGGGRGEREREERGGEAQLRAAKPSLRNDQRPRSLPPRPHAAPSPRRARPQSAAEPHPPPIIFLPQQRA
jgi:hypothetical protein